MMEVSEMSFLSAVYLQGFYTFKTYFDRVIEKYPSGMRITKKIMQNKNLKWIEPLTVTEWVLHLLLKSFNDQI